MSEIFPEFNGSISSILRTNYKQLNSEGEVTYWDISIWSTEDIYYTYTGIYEEIVGTVTAAFRDLVGNKYHAFAGNQHYILNHENKTVISTETYG